jgi:integrase
MTRLSKRTVDAVEVPATGEAFVWDSELRGFGLRVKSTGLKAYLIQYRTPDGRTRRHNLGRHGLLAPEAARGLALQKLASVATGADPSAERKAARAALTVGELCDLYVTERLATRKPLSVASARSDIENHIKPLLGRERAAAITAEDVDRLLLDVAAGKTAKRRKTRKQGLSRVRGGKGAANSAVTTLAAALNFGIRRGVRLDNPALGVRKFPEKKLERFLSPAELARLGEALAAAEALGVESPFALAAIRLLILTGARKNEILTLRRSYVDAHNRCLRLPDSKTGAKVVHIGEAALALIEAVPVVEGNPYLLPGWNGAEHLVNLQSTWARIRDAAGLSDVRLHDLRHAFASLGARGGDSLLVIGALLGHRSAKTTHRYTHLADDPLKDAADRISAEVARLMGLGGRRTAGSRRAEVVQAPPGTKGVLGEVIDTRWVDTPAAAALLGHTVGTLQTYRWMGTGPRFRKIGRRIVYAMEDLEAWRREHEAVRAA